MARVDHPPTLNPTTNNNSITTVTATLPTATVPIVINLNTESHNRAEENIVALRHQLVTVQKELIDLRQTALAQGIRLQTLEFYWEQLKFLCPSLGIITYPVGNSTAPTQQRIPADKNDGPNPPNQKNKSPSGNTFTQPSTKKARKTPIPTTTYQGKNPYCPSCNQHHKGPCNVPCNQRKTFGHQAESCLEKICFNCHRTGHFKSNCPQRGTPLSYDLRPI